MAADRKNIEEKTREIVNKDIDEGKEMQSFQEAQNQLLQIQAAQKENIQVNRALSSAQSQNNETMAQAAGIMASGVGDGDYGGPVQGREIKFNPQTQAILGKYGYGKPKTQSSTQVSSGPVQGRGVIINNRTENKTTNNVQVNAPQTPVITKKGGDGGMAKFKAWISGTFAKQKEQETIRERNFRRQEWSLSRSSSKIMDKLEEVGKTIGERMDPRKISAAFMDQFKVLMFLLGFQFLSKNWEKILTTVDNIEKWIREQLDYFGITGKNKGGRSEFIKSLISFFGGNPEGKEGVLGTLKNLLKDSVDLLIDRFKLMMRERVDAVKGVKFPEINVKDLTSEEGILSIVKGLGVYLKDILACLISGRDGLASSIGNNISAAGRASALNEDATWVNKEAVKWNDSIEEGLSYGDANVLMSGKYKQNTVTNADYDFSGNLVNGTSSTIRRGSSINAMIKDGKSSTVNTAGVMSGFSELNTAANEYGKVLVDQDFFSGLRALGVDITHVPGVTAGTYKLVESDKTEADISNEGGDIIKSAATGYFTGKVADPITGTVIGGGLGTVIGGIAGGPLGAITGATIGAPTGKYLGKKVSPTVRAVAGAAKASSIRKNADKKMLRIVPEDAPGDPYPLLVEDKNSEYGFNTKKYFTLFEITPKGMESLRQRVESALQMKKGTFSFDTSSKDSMLGLDKALTELKKKKLKENSSKIYDPTTGKSISHEKIDQIVTSDFDKNAFNELDELDRKTQLRYSAYKERYNNSQTKQFVDNVKEGVQNISKTVRDKAESYFNTPMTDEVQAALKLIQGNEGFEENDYESGGDGKTTLGFGMTVEANPQLKKYRQADGTYKITREQATEELTNLIIRNKKIAKKALGDIWDELNVNQKAVTLDMLHGNPNAFRGKRPAFAVPLLNRDWETLKGFEPFRVPYTNPKLEEINRDGWDNRARLRQLIWNTPVNGQPNLEGEEGTYESEIASESTTTTNSESPIISQAEQQNLADTSSITPAWQVNNEEDNIPSTIKRAESVDYSKPVMWKPVNTELASSGTPTITKEVAQKVKGSTGGNGSESIILELQKITKGVNEQGEAIIMLSSSVNNLATVAASNGNNTTIVNNSNNKQSAPSYTREPNTWPSTGYGNGNIAS